MNYILSRDLIHFTLSVWARDEVERGHPEMRKLIQLIIPENYSHLVTFSGVLTHVWGSWGEEF